MEYSGQLQVHLTEPPRTVPLALRISLLFGGTLNTIGWVFFGFGGVFVWMFAMHGDYSFFTFSGPTLETTGVIVRSERTSTSEGGSDSRPGTPIYANYFKYEADGVEFESVSYATGRSLEPGRKAEVEFLANKPREARIKGMRRALFPPFVAFVVIFPLIGLAFILARLRNAVKSIRLLHIGRSSTGTLRSKIPTNVSINNQPVFRMTFDFMTAEGRKGEVVVRTHETTQLEDEENERLIYDPYDLQNGITFDDLPGNTRIDAAGNFYTGLYLSTMGSLVLPLATLGGHGWWIYINYFAP